MQAAERLQGEGLNVIFHPFDVTDPRQIKRLAHYMETTR